VLKWRAEHSNLPSNARERASFRQLLKSWQRSIDGVPLEVCADYIKQSCLCRQPDTGRPMWNFCMAAMQEDNFNEAISNAHKMWSPPGIRECACTLRAVVHSMLAGVCDCACKTISCCA
jgi:hypothetical protein